MLLVQGKDTCRNLRKHSGNHQGVFHPRIAKSVSDFRLGKLATTMVLANGTHIMAMTTSGLQNQPCA
jgi:hypothetical protein